MNHRYSFILFLFVVSLLTFTSCNDEWKEEQYKHLISFKAPLNYAGTNRIYVRYKPHGKVTYKLPLIVSGSTPNPATLNVNVALDLDTLARMNQERFSIRKDLYYKLLPEKYYDFPSTVTIPSGEHIGYLDIDFTLSDLDMVDKWILPITVTLGSGYAPNMRKHYRKALLRIFPFNDYSGTYSATAMKTYFYDEASQQEMGDPLVENERQAFVVNENTVFFYAGLMGEELIRREKYKILVTFNEDKSLTLSAADPDIRFEVPEGATPIWSQTSRMDEVIPYIEHRYTSLRLTYFFDDVTSASVPIRYKVTGTLLMERRINTQIPDEDQSIQW